MSPADAGGGQRQTSDNAHRVRGHDERDARAGAPGRKREAVDAQEGASTAELFEFARFVFKRAGKRWPLALALLIGASLAEGASILLLIPVLSASFGDGAVIGASPGIYLPLEMGLTLLVALVAFQALLTRAKTLCLQRIFIDFVSGLRLDLFDAVMGARWAFIAQQRGADLSHLMTADVERAGAAAINVLALTQTCVVLLAYLAMSLLISPVMTGFAVAIGSASLIFLAPVRRRAMAQGLTITDIQRDQYRTVSDFIAGLKTARTLNAEPRFRAQLSEALSRMGAEIVAFTRLSATRAGLVQVLSIGALAIFLWVSIRFFGLPLPQIVAMVLIFMRVSPRFMGVQAHIQEILRGMPLVWRMRALMARCNDAREYRNPGAPRARLTRELTFSRVSFGYEGPEVRADALSEVSFSVPAGGAVALIGRSGAGKTTIADLAMGLIAPSAGQVLVDGRDLAHLDCDAWRASVGYVGQDVFLLNDSVAANLRLGAPDADEPALWAALKAAHLDQVIGALPQGLATVLGDRGSALSGGERQRMALARALLRHPDLLVLDEATSALDWKSQSAIAAAIRDLKGRCSVLIIAHRPAMVAAADWVVALEGGVIVEQGPYAALAQDADTQVSRLIAGEAGS